MPASAGAPGGTISEPAPETPAANWYAPEAPAENRYDREGAAANWYAPEAPTANRYAPETPETQGGPAADWYAPEAPTVNRLAPEAPTANRLTPDPQGTTDKDGPLTTGGLTTEEKKLKSMLEDQGFTNVSVNGDTFYCEIPATNSDLAKKTLVYINGVCEEGGYYLSCNLFDNVVAPTKIRFTGQISIESVMLVMGVSR